MTDDPTKENQSAQASVEDQPHNEQAASTQSESTQQGNEATNEPEKPAGSELEGARAEANALRDKLLRTVADMENLRRRVAREKDEMRRYGPSALVEDLLPALDNLKLGLKSALEHHPEAKAVIEGFQMVEIQISGVLQQHGVEAIEPKGQPFDPNLHEGVSHIPSPDVPENHVVEVLRIGYKLHDRLLRPATVVVSSGNPQ